MKKIIIIILVIIFLIFTAGIANAITNNERSEEIETPAQDSSNILRTFNFDVGWFLSENQVPTAEITAPDDIIIADGLYPIIINWDATAFLKENRGEIYDAMFTLVVNTLGSQNMFSWTESTWPGNVDLSNNLFHIIQVFSPTDAGKTHFVYISMSISYDNSDVTVHTHKTINLTLGKIKSKTSNPVSNPIIGWFIELFSVFRRVLFAFY